MRMPGAAWVTIAWFSWAAWAQAPLTEQPGTAHLSRAVELLEVPDYAGALDALDQGLSAQGNDRQTLLGLYELRGVVAASLREQDKALESFQRLLVLAPDFKPPRDYSPRVNGPFLEARAWLAEHAPLRFAPLPPHPEKGVLRSLGAAVLSDPLQQAREVRFHLRAQNGQWNAQRVPLKEGSATVALQELPTGWWAELLGEHTAVLSRIGSEQSPIVEGGLGRSGFSLANLRPHQRWSLGLAAGGVLAAGVGAFFGADAEGARRQIAIAERDPVTGRIIGLTQPQAFALERRAQSGAVIANILFASGAALACGAGAVWFLGAGTELTPTGVRGTF